MLSLHCPSAGSKEPSGAEADFGEDEDEEGAGERAALKAAELAKHFPPLLVLVRDFTLARCAERFLFCFVVGLCLRIGSRGEARSPPLGVVATPPTVPAQAPTKNGEPISDAEYLEDALRDRGIPRSGRAGLLESFLWKRERERERERGLWRTRGTTTRGVRVSFVDFEREQHRACASRGGRERERLPKLAPLEASARLCVRDS